MIAIALLGFLVTGSEPNFSNKNILAIHKRNQAKYSKGLGNTKNDKQALLNYEVLYQIMT